ncbi:MAG: type I secretion system permease/ATPase [Betaproteobacteria bacterium]|nr:type I secretion system permease/ATPase [Betaproteobacteria bacterium]
MNMPVQRSELGPVLGQLKSFFKRAAVFSIFTNVFALGPTLYMFQVYGRVVDSRNYLTLTMLTLAVVGLYVFLEMIEWVRTRLLHNAGLQFDAILCERVFNAIFQSNLVKPSGGSAQPLSDLRTLREFMSSHALLAMMDVPFSLLYLIVIFMIHPVLGLFSLVGAIVQTVVSLLNEKSMRPPLTAANNAAIAAGYYAKNSLRNAQVIEAMGMGANIERRWMEKQGLFLRLQAVASDIAGGSGAASKFIQLTQSSMILGLGAYLNVKGQAAAGGGIMSGGLIIVASVLGGKVVAPLMQALAQWKMVITARNSYERLDQLLQSFPENSSSMTLPTPKGNLEVAVYRATAPGSNAAILQNVGFTLAAGEILAVIGPSASGKSTLSRLLVGIWPAAVGGVRLDSADIYAWNKAELGPHIGYLPQDVELLEGSLAENIARFGEIDMVKVEAAARLVGLHEMIMALPQAYDTFVGEDGCFLSGGQRQRVGLARALYGNPRFVVLDEPNSSLDEEGELALIKAMLALKKLGTTQVVITHRPLLLSVVDRILVLHNGTIKDFGPRETVLANIAKMVEQQVARMQPKKEAGVLPAAARLT